MAEDFGENFRGGRNTVMCPYCELHKDSQEETFNQCSFMQSRVEITGDYTNIFDNNVQKKVIKTITRISNFRKSK